MLRVNPNTQSLILRKNIKKIVLAFFVFVLFSLIINMGYCFSQEESKIETEWAAHSANPVIKMGDGMPKAQWNDPSVIKIGEHYVMYLTANRTAAGQNVVPFRAISVDGIHWRIDRKSLLARGRTKKDFDYAKIETPSVIYFRGKYHMYYTGVKTDLSGILAIGHAISSDGISWEKDSGNPVLAPTGNIKDWNGAQVAEPGAVVFNDKVYLYFAAVGLRGGNGPAAKRTIGLAISDDGDVFQAPVKVLEQSAQYSVVEDYSGYSTPSAVAHNGKLHLFYDVVLEKPDFIQVAILYAFSNDGIHWTEDERPIFKREDFQWTAREIRAPCVIVDGNALKIWFAGDDYLKSKIWGIGYAYARSDDRN